MNINKMTRENINQLEETARAMVAPGKGLLAADESNPTIKKRFETIGVKSSEETRQSYRQLLFTTPKIQTHISGVILYEETLGQSTRDKILFPTFLAERGIIPGIKVDKGVTTIPGTNGEKATQGLDGLARRLEIYREQGARFTKWRAVLEIGDHRPSRLGVDINCHALARYAAISQEAGLVPIVEPEILMAGSHDIETCERVSRWVLGRLFSELVHHRVILGGMILKPSMVTSGDKNSAPGDIEAVARATIRTFEHSVPAAVPGIVFLSGGQSSELATAHLNAMNQLGGCPWELSFSYGRALQEKTLLAWKGNTDNISLAQKILLHRAKCNGAARYGNYTFDMEDKI